MTVISSPSKGTVSDKTAAIVYGSIFGGFIVIVLLVVLCCWCDDRRANRKWRKAKGQPSRREERARAREEKARARQAKEDAMMRAGQAWEQQQRRGYSRKVMANLNGNNNNGPGFAEVAANAGLVPDLQRPSPAMCHVPVLPKPDPLGIYEGPAYYRENGRVIPVLNAPTPANLRRKPSLPNIANIGIEDVEKNVPGAGDVDVREVNADAESVISVPEREPGRNYSM